MFPGSGPVQVQEDLHLAFEVESMKDFQNHLIL